MNVERKRPSQKLRVLRALAAVGGRGITQGDFLPPAPVDRYGPISRLGARIHELREDGHEIVEHGWRDGFRVYRLVREAWQPIPPPTPPAPAVPAAQPRLLDPPPPAGEPLSLLAGTPYDPFSEAA